MTSVELRAERFNARVTEARNLQEVRMPLTEQQHERLKMSIGRIRKTPEFQTVRLFLVSESSEEKPDYPGLRRLILETFANGLDLEIEAVKDRRKRETA